LDKVLATRATDNTLQLRKEIVLAWKADQAMNWQNNYIFIDETEFNMRIRRNFGRSKRGMPAKASFPSNKGITVAIIGAICEKGVVDLTLRKPKAVQKSRISNKKRERKR
ncbi:hypothetical protein BCV72DRAFT_208868, partial [Rhizopus microsporus var. microsporus]